MDAIAPLAQAGTTFTHFWTCFEQYADSSMILVQAHEAALQWR